jgi:hypothetical protein
VVNLPHSPQYNNSLTPPTRQRRNSSITNQITALPSSSKASLHQVRENPVEHHSAPLRRLSDPAIRDPLAPLPSPEFEAKNPIKEPNWPDTTFTQSSPKSPHLHSEVQDQIEQWQCGNPLCERLNQKSVKRCKWCRWVLPRAIYTGDDGVRRDGEVLLRKWGGQDGTDGTDGVFEEQRPTGDAPGGGKWIPRSETEQRRDV